MVMLSRLELRVLIVPGRPGFTRLAELICQECDLIYLSARNGCRELFADDGDDAGTEQFYGAQHFLMWQR
jgi:hypothetical protein